MVFRASSPLSNNTDNERVVTGNTTVLSTDGTLLVDASAGNITVTFPVSSTINGEVFSISKIDSTGNIVTIAKNAADSFSNGAPSLTLSVQGDSYTLQASSTKSMLVIV